MVHYIITRDANSVSWAEIGSFSQHDINNSITMLKITVFDIICYAAYNS